MQIRNLIILLCCMMLSCACSNQAINGMPAARSNGGTISTPKTSTFKQNHTLEILAFIDSYSNLSPEMQKKVFSETSQLLADNKNNLLYRLKLASMLSLPSSRLRDNAKAQLLLQDLLQGNTLNASDFSLISLLYEYTADYNKQLQKSREDLKKLESVQQKYDALELKNKILEQKLNELKIIEKTMNDRDSKSGN